MPGHRRQLQATQHVVDHVPQRHRRTIADVVHLAKGRLAIIGNGLNKVDFTSVHNLNDALLGSLQVGGAALGQVYNISNGAPVPLWDVVNYVLRRLELPPVTRHVPFPLAYAAATLNEGVCRLWPGRPEPSLFRLGVAVMARDFSLNIDRARECLGYEPRASLWDALDEFCTWWQAQMGPQA
jgi:nucleoside-diphosphate-sugar epimerase